MHATSDAPMHAVDSRTKGGTTARAPPRAHSSLPLCGASRRTTSGGLRSSGSPRLPPIRRPDARGNSARVRVHRVASAGTERGMASLVARIRAFSQFPNRSDRSDQTRHVTNHDNDNDWIDWSDASDWIARSYSRARARARDRQSRAAIRTL